MIKKQNIWALTLFSLILVLSVYYITLPDEIDVKNVAKEIKTTLEEDNKSEIIMTLKTENEDEKNEKIKELQDKLNDEELSKEDKNNIFEELKTLNLIKSKEEEISLKIEDKYKADSFVKIDGDKVKVIISKKDHNSTLASEIMDFVQSNFDEKKYISVKFVEDNK